MKSLVYHDTLLSKQSASITSSLGGPTFFMELADITLRSPRGIHLITEYINTWSVLLKYRVKIDEFRVFMRISHDNSMPPYHGEKN